MRNSKALVGVILAVGVLLFFYLFTPVRYVRYFAVVYLLVIAGGFLYSRIVPFAVDIVRADPVLRGIKLQDIELRLRVRNKTIFPVPYFSLSDTRGQLFSDSGTFAFSLGPFEERTLSYIVKGHSRGEFPVGPVTMKGSDPFGFFPWQRRVDAKGSVIVYPTIHPMDLVYRQGLPSGSLHIDDKMYEDVTQFRSLREYVPGDDMKRINWKASAKNNKLYTMEFDSTLYFPVLTVLNFCRDDFPMRHREALIERAAEIAASIPFFYTNLKQEIGFVSTGNLKGETGFSTVPMKAGYEHAQGILELISKLQPVDGRADFNELFFQSGVNIQMGTKVIVVSPPFSQQQADVLIAAKRKGTNLLVLQIEPLTERVADEHFKGALKVISVKELGRETIHG
jgi:uncharacterized protein (DUF58 family)